MDIAMLIIGILALVAAALAAWFAYPAWKESRTRPDLRLIVERKGYGGGSDSRSVSMYVRLRNDGDGPAIGWNLTIRTDRRRFRIYDDPSGGYSDRETAPGWTFTWQSQGADDTIDPGLHRDVLLGLDAFLLDETVVGRYTIKARRMKERAGEVRVSHPPDQAEPSIVVT